MILKLTFPGEAETDYSDLLIDQSVQVTMKLMNDERRSVVDTCRFELKYDQALQILLFSANDWIQMSLTEDDTTAIFTGVIAPNYGLRKKTNVMPIRFEAVDNSYLLDEPINTSFNYPSSIGGSAYAVFDADNSSNNVVWELLDDAGYTPASDIASGAPDVSTTVEYFQGTKDDETYREYLDTLLSEYGYVFYFNAAGEFSVYQWDKDTVTDTFTVNEDIEIRHVNQPHDGFEVEFAQTATDTDALLYRDNLPVSQTSGEWSFTGEAIANNDYYPPDGDIDDIWQDYSVKWLDKPWLARETRLKNKDLSLIAADASDSTVDFIADTGVDISSSTYEARRAKVLFQNTSGDTAKIYNFEIKGTALYRKYRRFTRAPNTSTRPKKYTSRFLHNTTLSTIQAHATRFARAMNNVIQNGEYIYEWNERTERSVGDIGNVNMTDPSVDQDIVIIEKRWNPQLGYYGYTGHGISAYSASVTISNRGEKIAASDPEDPTRPTKTEIDDGYDNDDPSASNPGTTTPTVPTVVAKAMGNRAILLEWDAQKTLTNFDRYEIQVSQNESNWYDIDQDGDGLGTINQDTDWWSTTFVHGRLPLGGDVDDPSATTWYYRVRRVPKTGSASAWSSVVSAQAVAIGAGDLAANSVYINNLIVGFLEAAFANVEHQLTIGYAGTGTASSPDEGDRRVYLDEDELRIEIYTDSAWSSERRIRFGGVDTNGNFLPFFQGRGLIGDFDNAPTDDPVPADSSLRLFKFEDNMEDQDGTDPWTINLGTVAYSSAKKFEGTYSFTATDSLINAQYSNGWTSGTSCSAVFRFRYDDGENTNHTLVGFNETNLNDAIWMRIGYYDGGVKLNANIDKGGTETTIRSGNVSTGVWHLCAIIYDADTNTLSLWLDDTVTTTNPSGTWGTPASKIVYLEFLSGTVSATDYERYMDDLLISPSYAISNDRILQHYERGRPWTPEYAIEDVLVLPDPGGQVRVGQAGGDIAPVLSGDYGTTPGLTAEASGADYLTYETTDQSTTSNNYTTLHTFTTPPAGTWVWDISAGTGNTIGWKVQLYIVGGSVTATGGYSVTCYSLSKRAIVELDGETSVLVQWGRNSGVGGTAYLAYLSVTGYRIR